MKALYIIRMILNSIFILQGASVDMLTQQRCDLSWWDQSVLLQQHFGSAGGFSERCSGIPKKMALQLSSLDVMNVWN